MIFVTVSRKWHNPIIFSYVDNQEISLSISLEDFKKVVKREVTASMPADEIKKIVRQELGDKGIWNQNRFDDNFNNAFDRARKKLFDEGYFDGIIENAFCRAMKGLKEESNKIMGG